MTSLPPERLLMPFGPGAFRMVLGLVACPPDAIVELDECYTEEMAERRDLLANRHDAVFAAIPGSEAARSETLDTLAAVLTERHPAWFGRTGAYLHNRLTGEAWNLERPPHDPLELAGRLVQEDLCLIDASGAAPVLCAAILCAPSRWRLAEKIGRPLGEIHAPVPGYAERLSSPVDRFMTSLRPGRCAERLNWSVVDDRALFQPTVKPASIAVTAENAPDRLFVRIERQTLMRLPRSGFILFAIRVHSYPLARIIALPDAAARLLAAVSALPPAIIAYKSMDCLREPLLACLAHAAFKDRS